jgi:hypothetical protein
MEMSAFLSRRKRTTSTPKAAIALFAIRSLARRFSRWGTIAIFVLWAARESIAGTTVIGELHPYPQPNVTPAIHGITFDADPNPRILDVWAWTLQRIDKTNSAVLSSVTSNPVSSHNDQLVYDRSSGDYFTLRTASNSTSLVRIDHTNYANATVGALGTPQINYFGLGIDPSDNLWLGIDSGSAQLWSINKNTGQATFNHNITYPGGLGLHSMTIASDGTFFATATSFLTGGEGVYRINSSTGAATFITSTDTTGTADIVSLTQDPSSSRYYGISQRFDFNQSAFEYSLVEVTGIPEPNCVAILLATTAVGFARRRG